MQLALVLLTVPSKSYLYNCEEEGMERKALEIRKVRIPAGRGLEVEGLSTIGRVHTAWWNEHDIFHHGASGCMDNLISDIYRLLGPSSFRVDSIWKIHLRPLEGGNKEDKRFLGRDDGSWEISLQWLQLFLSQRLVSAPKYRRERIRGIRKRSGSWRWHDPSSKGGWSEFSLHCATLLRLYFIVLMHVPLAT